MNFLLELAAYHRIVGYLNGHISLRDFREWFDSETWEQTADSDLLGQIELSLAELSSHHRSEDEFKETLHSYIRGELTLHLNPHQELVETGTSNLIKTFPPLALLVGSIHEMEPA